MAITSSSWSQNWLCRLPLFPCPSDRIHKLQQHWKFGKSRWYCSVTCWNTSLDTLSLQNLINLGSTSTDWCYIVCQELPAQFWYQWRWSNPTVRDLPAKVALCCNLESWTQTSFSAPKQHLKPPSLLASHFRPLLLVTGLQLGWNFFCWKKSPTLATRVPLLSSIWDAGKTLKCFESASAPSSVWLAAGPYCQSQFPKAGSCPRNPYQVKCGSNHLLLRKAISYDETGW